MARFSRSGTAMTGRSGAVRGLGVPAAQPASNSKRAPGVMRLQLGQIMIASYPGSVSRCGSVGAASFPLTPRPPSPGPPPLPPGEGPGVRAQTTPTSTPPGRSPPAPAGYTPPAMPENQLRFTGLSRRFGRLAVLAGVSGEAADGEVLLVTGTNGSGKSTLLKCLAGLLAPDKGAIESREGGRALDAVDRRRRVGLVAPDLAFYEELTTAENLAFFSRLRGDEPHPP